MFEAKWLADNSAASAGRQNRPLVRNVMAKLKVALRALGRGELKGEVVVDRIGKLLAREPALLQRVLSELLDAYVNGAIEAQTFVKLKSHASRCAGASETLGSRHARAATAAIRQLIEAARGPLPPVFVLQFLLYDWRQSLAVVHREYGEASGDGATALECRTQSE